MNRLFTLIALVALLAGPAFGQAHATFDTNDFLPDSTSSITNVSYSYAGAKITGTFPALTTASNDTGAWKYSSPVTVPMASADGTFYLSVENVSGTLDLSMELGTFESPERGVVWEPVVSRLTSDADSALALGGITRRTTHLANTYIVRWYQHAGAQSNKVGWRLKIFQPRTRE